MDNENSKQVEMGDNERGEKITQKDKDDMKKDTKERLIKKTNI